ncbi:MAG: hypothetical protein AB8B71_15655 [Paracoccaceae bacterium]
MCAALTKLMLCLLLGAAFFVSSRFIKNAPAYTEDLRAETIYGAERLPLTASMYDRGAYFFEVAYTYINGTIDVRAPGQLVPPVKQIIENGRLAEELVAKSLLADPGNAHAWALLAEARLLQGSDVAAILEPLRISWALAPNSAVLAEKRLQLVANLIEIYDAASSLNTDISRIQTDATLLARFDPRPLEVFLEMSDGLEAMIGTES